MEKFKPLISIIVPVYNQEQYLERCVKSLINQNYNNIEIILVDDGSTDGSAKICDAFESEDKRIKVIHQTNQGLSGARNSGIEKARGEWLAFVDADDFVAKSFCNRMLSVAINYNADIVHCRWKRGKDSVIDEPVEKEVKIYSGIECYLNFFTEKKLPYMESANNKLYNARLFSDHRFIPGRIMEDMAIMHNLFEQARTVAFVDEEHYYYYQSDNSIIRGKFTVNKLTALLSYEERLEFFYKIGGEELWGRALRQYQDTLFRYYYWLKRDCPNEVDELNKLKDKMKDNHNNLKRQKTIGSTVKLLSAIGVCFPYITGYISEKLIVIRFWRR